MRSRGLMAMGALILAMAGPAGAEIAPGAAAPPPQTTGPTVKIENFTFNPAELTVKPGTTVTFENDDDIPHSIVEKTAKFKSKALDTGDTFALTLTEVGDVDYFCGLHPHMVGKIIVKP